AVVGVGGHLRLERDTGLDPGRDVELELVRDLVVEVGDQIPEYLVAAADLRLVGAGERGRMVDLQVPVAGRRSDRPADPADPESEVERVGDAERRDPAVPLAGVGELAEGGRARDRDAVAGSAGAGTEAVRLRAGLEPRRPGVLRRLGDGVVARG